MLPQQKLESEVVLPEGCFRRKAAVEQILSADLWNLQKKSILDIPSDPGGKIDKLWKTSSEEDSKHFCFATHQQATFCDSNSKLMFTFLCAFCLRNKFGKEGEKSMVTVCNYRGPMTRNEKLQLEDASTEEVEYAVGASIEPDAGGFDQVRAPS